MSFRDTSPCTIKMKCKRLAPWGGKKPALDHNPPHTVSLVFTCAYENNYRYLELKVASDLFGPVVYRRWGRLNYTENVETYAFETVSKAENFVEAYMERKCRSGYQVRTSAPSKALLIAGYKNQGTVEKIDSEEILVKFDDLPLFRERSQRNSPKAEVIQFPRKFNKSKLIA